MEKLTDGPVGVGTRYRARWSNSGPTAVEVIRFDRLPRWETNAKARAWPSGSKAPSPTPRQGRATPPPGTHPKGLARLVAPFALLTMRARTSRHASHQGGTEQAR